MKYAILDTIIDKKTDLKIINPWILKGAQFYKDINQVPQDAIIISTIQHWSEPIKSWADNGGKFIEIEYGYWGVRLPINKPRIQTRRVTYCGSHNCNMKESVPFSRVDTLQTPVVQPWKKELGNYILIVEPHPEWYYLRTGVSIGDWRQKMLDLLSPFWNGEVRWRRKMSGAKKDRFRSFKNDIENCYAVIGERTMACVEAVMLGSLAYTIDETAVTPLMGNDLSILKNPIFPDRTKWLEHIAWSQFHLKEFQNGSTVADLVEEYQIRK